MLGLFINEKAAICVLKQLFACNNLPCVQRMSLQMRKKFNMNLIPRLVIDRASYCSENRLPKGGPGVALQPRVLYLMIFLKNLTDLISRWENDGLVSHNLKSDVDSETMNLHPVVVHLGKRSCLR